VGEVVLCVRSRKGEKGGDAEGTWQFASGKSCRWEFEASATAIDYKRRGGEM